MHRLNSPLLLRGEEPAPTSSPAQIARNKNSSHQCQVAHEGFFSQLETESDDRWAFQCTDKPCYSMHKLAKTSTGKPGFTPEWEWIAQHLPLGSGPQARQCGDNVGTMLVLVHYPDRGHSVAQRPTMIESLFLRQ